MSRSTIVADLAAALADRLQERQLELPVLPGVAAEVLALSQQETTDAARLSAVVHRDQALAGNVLRVANSAAYAGQVPCSSLQQAVSRLGLQLVGEIAIAVALKGRLFAGTFGAELFAELWRHSVLTAFFTKEIARLRRRNVEIAFLCGLLHDVGKAVLLAEVARLGTASSRSLGEVAAAIDVHHEAAGVQLARHWQLPDQIAECIECHHDVRRAKRFAEMAMTVQLADLLACEVAPTGHEPAPTIAVLERHPVLASLNLYPDQLAALLARRDDALRLVEGMR